VVLGNATSQRVHLHGFEVVFGMSAMALYKKGWKKKWLREIYIPLVFGSFVYNQ
jgi:hypothetical protein